jgi:hypothetical protein
MELIAADSVLFLKHKRPHSFQHVRLTRFDHTTATLFKLNFNATARTTAPKSPHGRHQRGAIGGDDDARASAAASLITFCLSAGSVILKNARINKRPSMMI